MLQFVNSKFNFFLDCGKEIKLLEFTFKAIIEKSNKRLVKMNHEENFNQGG